MKSLILKKLFSQLKNNKKVLRIAVEAFSLSEEKLTGIGKVALHYLKELQKLDNSNKYYIYTNDRLRHLNIYNKNWQHIEIISPFKGKKNRVTDRWLELKGETSKLKGRNLITSIKTIKFRIKKMIYISLDKLFFLLLLINSIRKNKIDIYIGTFADYFPALFLSKLKKVWIIHDIVWKLFPETMKINEKLTSFFIRRNMKRCDLLISVSENTKKDIEEILNIKTEIAAIHNAADDKIFYRADISSILKIKKKYKIYNKYILSVSTLEPRKNIESLIKAYSKIEQKDECKLVLVGKIGWAESEFFESIEKIGIKNNIIITGYIPEEDLAPLYSGADLFVFPTLYEGFGLPVLEAMKCGCPVISSNSSSIPEVIGDAGIMIDPKDINGLISSIEMTLKDSSLRKEMSKKGLNRSKLFSWEKSAEELLERIISLCTITH